MFFAGFFCFKQKTAYEMRISDWSSDVCSSDLIGIGCTLVDPAQQDALPLLRIDEPTLTMNFMVNSSPLAGREGKFVTSRQVRDRLDRELKSNVALRVNDTDDDMVVEVCGRGDLHLTILLENMRREGYARAGSVPRRGPREGDGGRME